MSIIIQNLLSAFHRKCSFLHLKNKKMTAFLKQYCKKKNVVFKYGPSILCVIISVKNVFTPFAYQRVVKGT